MFPSPPERAIYACIYQKIVDGHLGMSQMWVSLVLLNARNHWSVEFFCLGTSKYNIP